MTGIDKYRKYVSWQARAYFFLIFFLSFFFVVKNFFGSSLPHPLTPSSTKNDATCIVTKWVTTPMCSKVWPAWVKDVTFIDFTTHVFIPPDNFLFYPTPPLHLLYRTQDVEKFLRARICTQLFHKFLSLTCLYSDMYLFSKVVKSKIDKKKMCSFFYVTHIA